jgi:hypothetical protein
MSNAPISFKQGSSISAYRIVRVTSTPNTVAACTATTDIIIGVTTDDCSNANQAVPVAVSGVAKVYMNDTAASGALVMTDASGRGVPFVESTAGVYTVGVLLNTVSATGTLAEVLIQPRRMNDVP